MSNPIDDPRSDRPGGPEADARDASRGEELPSEDLLGDADELDTENLQSSTGGGMGPESFPPEEDDDYSGNGAGRGPS